MFFRLPVSYRHREENGVKHRALSRERMNGGLNIDVFFKLADEQQVATWPPRARATGIESMRVLNPNRIKQPECCSSNFPKPPAAAAAAGVAASWIIRGCTETETSSQEVSRRRRRSQRVRRSDGYIKPSDASGYRGTCAAARRSSAEARIRLVDPRQLIIQNHCVISNYVPGSRETAGRQTEPGCRCS